MVLAIRVSPKAFRKQGDFWGELMAPENTEKPVVAALAYKTLRPDFVDGFSFWLGAV